jgi:hypothetical protein
MEASPKSCAGGLSENPHPLAASFAWRALLNLTDSDPRALDKRLNEVFRTQGGTGKILRPIEFVGDNDPSHILSWRATYDDIVGDERLPTTFRDLAPKAACPNFDHEPILKIFEPNLTF